MAAEIREKKILAFDVRNEGEYATISIQPNTLPGNGNSVQVSIYSSFGNFGHYWASIGDDPWWKFLGSLDMPYAAGKLMSDSELFEFDPEGTIDSCKRSVRSQLDEESITKDRALEIFEQLDRISEWQNGPDLMLSELGEIDFFIEDYYEHFRKKMKPFVDRFWHVLWRPWIEEVEKRNAI